MTNNLTGPELFASASSHLDDIVEGEASYESASGVQVDNRLLYATIANARTTQALTAAVLMLVENHHDFAPYETEAWRGVIPLPDLKECKGENTRRPACAKWHTEDCRYSDPVLLAGTRVIHRPTPADGARMGTVREQERDASGDYYLRVEWDSGELKWIAQTNVVVTRHERLPVGIRVLVFGSMIKREGGRIDFEGQPWAGKILGHPANGTYKIAREYGPGRYGEDYPQYVFMDERVSVHPEGPECPQPEGYTKPEPTGPRVYVQRPDGLQGYIVGSPREGEGAKPREVEVSFFRPTGNLTRWYPIDALSIILSEDVERCNNGQTINECRETDLCELCQQAQDAETATIERDMGLR